MNAATWLDGCAFSLCKYELVGVVEAQAGSVGGGHAWFMRF